EAMDDALETSIERLRDHLRRPHARKRNHLTENAAYTVNQTDPRWTALPTRIWWRRIESLPPLSPRCACFGPI
ncbi:hypothetical protein, partial [Mycobacterium ulcerans]|uniref:hypothetical protein n=1 Tax=Mycobacterium ulcerans TaxID=1809 RepID=UPI001E418F1D